RHDPRPPERNGAAAFVGHPRPTSRVSDGPAHDNVAFAEGGHDLESCFLEHGHRAPPVHIRSPAGNRIGFNESPSLASDRCQGGGQGSARYSAPAMPFIDDKAGDSPQPLGASGGGELPIPRVVLNPRKLLPGAVLAPSHRLSLHVDEDPMRAT